MTPIAPAMAPMPAMKNSTALTVLFPLPAQGRPLERLGQQHLLGEDQVAAVVVRQLVVVAHRDRVERARDLAVAAEDAAAHVDLVHGRVALAGGHAMFRRVLRGDDADAVRRAGGGAERAADALLEARVLELVELVPPAEPRVDRHLLLRVLHGRRALDHAGEGGLQPAQGLAEGPVGRARAGLRRADDLEDVVADVDVRNSHDDSVTATMIAVTSALAVASGSST